MNNELKPCPFCGGKAEIREYAHGHGGNGEFRASYEVKCTVCRINFKNDSLFSLKDGQPIFAVNGYDRCVEQWNRRARDE